MGKKLVLIDGHSILNRAFYGVPDLSNAAGLHTNAVLGFLNIMFKILDEEKADYLCVAFDVNAPTFRHDIYAEYKGTRKSMPEELREQVPVMKEVLKAMNIRIMEKAGLEADDILGTLAKRFEKLGFEVSLVSGDRDLLQIASEHIKIRIPKTKAGKTEIEDYNWKDVEEKYQVNPIQFIDLKALMGDTSDNIPGVPKVGEKTATDLIVQYGSIDEIYHHLEDITKKSIKETLEQNRHLADLSKVLATINIDCDIEYQIEEFTIENFYTKEAYVLFKQLEFKNLLTRFTVEDTVQNIEKKHFSCISDFNDAEKIFVKAKEAEYVGVYAVESGKTEEEFVGLALAISEEEIYFIEKSGFLTKDYLTGHLSTLKQQTHIAGFYIKGIYDYLKTQSSDGLFDIQLAAYLLNPLKNDYHMDDIANEFLEWMIPEEKQVLGKRTYAQAFMENRDEIVDYACTCASVVFHAKDVLERNLVDTGMSKLFYEMEMPLTLVLYDMEQEGILIRPDELKAYGEALTERILELEQNIYTQSGVTFNINSPKQMGEVLFETMGIPGGKKTKTGYSTGAEVLEKLAEEYPIVSDILEFRGLMKLKTTYAEGLASCIQADSRIHTTFNQTIAATGRISSTEPNLQNIPMRMELGRLIRKVFVPKEGCIFMDADYSQIELRIMAHMSGDEKLIEAYRTDADIHRITASQVFHTPFHEVTDTQRRNAKAVNFGIIYGISSFGLSQGLSISRKEAAKYIEQYFETYPKVKIFLENIVKEAKENGYVTTLFGRRRPIPELASSNFMQRSFGERVAMNSPLQGTAADIIKIAMIQVWSRLKKQGLRSKLILQVHDELLVETYIEEEAAVKEILITEMRNVAKLAVSLEIDLHTGNNWYEAK